MTSSSQALRKAEESAKNDYLNYDEEELAVYNKIRETAMRHDKSNRSISAVIAAIYDAFYFVFPATGFVKTPWLCALLIFSAFVISLTINSVIIKLHYTILRNNDPDNDMEKSRKAYKALLILRFLPYIAAGIMMYFASNVGYEFESGLFIPIVGFWGTLGLLDPINRCLYYKREIKNTRYIWISSI